MDGKIKAVLMVLLVLMSTEGYSQSCNITSKANDIVPDKLCAPVSVSWNVIYRGVDDGGTNVQMRYDWDDGSPIEIINATLVNATTGEWTSNNTHVYPIGGNRCNYHPRVTLMVNGVECTSSVQEQNVTVWDTDDMNGGELNINPIEYQICVGSGGTAHFTDNSHWNCTPPDEEDDPNEKKRWVQWIYGTNSGDANFIDDALVDGTLRTYPYEGAVEETTQPIWSPESPWRDALPITVNNTRAVGDEFEVELRNWNVCNPYPTSPPVITRARIIIVDDPDATITQPAPLCANADPIFLTAATAGGIWTGPGIIDPSTGEFDPSVAGEGNHTIEYSVMSAAGCIGTDNVVVQVEPTPSATISPGSPTSACPGVIINLDASPTGGTTPYTHNWSGDVGYLSNSTSPTPTFQADIEGIFNLTYRVTSPNGCYDEDYIQIITDTTSIQFTSKNFEVCSDISTVINPQPTGGSGEFVSHQWTGPATNLLSATDIQNPVFTGLATGSYNYTYTVTDSNGCSDFTTVTVIVHQQPAANAGTDAMACGLEIQPQAVPSIGTGNWTFVSGPGNVTISGAGVPNPDITADTYGDYTFLWTETNNMCVSGDEVLLSFNKIPTPSAMQDTDTCGLVYVLKATPDVGTGEWSLVSGIGTAAIGVPSNSQTSVIVSEPGNYTFRWTENNHGCIGYDDVTISFYPTPSALVAPFDNEQCSPATVHFENVSTDADTYLWDFGDGSISASENPFHSFSNGTFDIVDYEINLIANNSYGCVDTSTYSIRVKPNAVAAFSTDNTPGCSPRELELTNLSEGASSYEWHFGDGSPAESVDNPTHTFVNNEQYVQSYQVQLIVNNNYACRDTAETYITVYPTFSYDITATPLEGCHPLKVDLAANPGAYSYKWDFGNGNLTDGSNSMTHTFENTTTTPKAVDVQLFTSSAFGCLDTSSVTVTIHPSPACSFNISDNEGCSPILIDFENTSANTSSSHWFFGDGDSSTTSNTTVAHTYSNKGSSALYLQPKLIVENSYGCKDSSQLALRVFPEVNASIAEGGEGCSPHTESLANFSSGASSFFWDFDDGTTSNSFNGHHTFENNSIEDRLYHIAMVASSTYGCSDTAYTSVTAYRKPNPEFSITPQELQMPLSTIEINNTTKGNDQNYSWNFGDGSTSQLQQPGSHTYQASGEYDIWLNVNTVNCSDSAFKTVLIHPTLPLLDYGPNSQGCPPHTVQFYNHSIDAHTYFWDFGDGNVSASKEPVHTYYTPGTYTVSLMIEGPGGMVEGKDVQVQIYDKPFANFEIRPTVVKLPETVSFINKSEGALNYHWDFGDGNTSNEHSIQYAYTQAGSYDVSLLAINENGCRDSLTIRNAVTIKEAGKIDFPNSFTPNPNGPNGGAYVAGSPDNFVFYPFVKEGIVEYELKIFSRWGEIIFESNDISIGWDGYYRGKICAGGVYIWKVYCRYSNGYSETKTGDVTLFR
ncbi:PKD domain-containing protein [Carboxylicivirga taeanensis]|uniref:PKD domain-containing protein n=1 Tax=Carboxylicivirga taeanensis TaxID=1416875 RepID=UPI003F6E288E